MLKKRSEASTLTIDQDLQLPYLAEIMTETYQIGYVHQFQNFDKRKGNNHEHIVPFLDSTGAYCNLCLKKFQILTNCA